METRYVKITNKVDENGEVYWTASFPNEGGVVGGGRTIEEAVEEAKENLRVFEKFKKNRKTSVKEG